MLLLFYMQQAISRVQEVLFVLPTHYQSFIWFRKKCASNKAWCSTSQYLNTSLANNTVKIIVQTKNTHAHTLC